MNKKKQKTHRQLEREFKKARKAFVPSIADKLDEIIYHDLVEIRVRNSEGYYDLVDTIDNAWTRTLDDKVLLYIDPVEFLKEKLGNKNDGDSD